MGRPQNTLWKYSKASLLLLLIPCLTIAQDSDSLLAKETPNYVARINKLFVTRLSVNNNIEAFTVNTNTTKYIITPNTSLVSYLHVNYRLVSFSINYTPRFIPANKDNLLRGKTRSFGFGTGFNMGKTYSELSYAHTRGYYLNNSRDYMPGWKPGDAYIQFPQLTTNSFEGMTMYKFNPNFSMLSLTTQTETQLRSAGSLIPKLYYRYFTIDDEPRPGTQRSSNLQLIIGSGYHYTLVIKKKWYASLAFTPGFGFIKTKLRTRFSSGDILSYQYNTIVQLDGNLGLGYNGKRFFMGVLGTSKYLHYRQQNTIAVNSNLKMYYEIFLGYRFNAPKMLTQSYNAVMSKARHNKYINKYIED